MAADGYAEAMDRGGDVDLVAYLRRLVDEVCVPYRGLPALRAILSIGSVAYGIVDEFSDVDLALYYESLPSDDALRLAREANGCLAVDWAVGSRDDGAVMEQYKVRGVECQFVHTTIEAWERSMDTVLVDFDAETPTQKALSGVLAGTALLGGDVIEAFKSRIAAYPDGLATAMVRRYLQFQPLWRLEERLLVRDTLLWRTQAVVEGAQNLLGVLAGLNRLYYTTFQFKRMGAFIEEMGLKPANLEARLTAILKGEATVEEFRNLVAETVDLVEAHMPDIDTAAVRKQLNAVQHRWVPVLDGR